MDARCAGAGVSDFLGALGAAPGAAVIGAAVLAVARTRAEQTDPHWWYTRLGLAWDGAPVDRFGRRTRKGSGGLARNMKPRSWSWRAHLCARPNDSGGCPTCAAAACPYSDPLHDHHDGCPSCEWDQGNTRRPSLV
ncbi:MAG: hypothetical protein IT371_30270 [Deltaproteobacteria bacterium]|nr:hypothetical protein [Deltaproteobacteria bacterium]